jgi:hypothetical protein
VWYIFKNSTINFALGNSCEDSMLLVCTVYIVKQLYLGNRLE